MTTRADRSRPVVRALKARDIDHIERRAPRTDEGRTNVAILRLLYDGMLTAGELSDLRWNDITRSPDGALALRLPSTSEAEPQARRLGPRAEAALKATGELRAADERLVPLSAAEIDERVRRAAKAAGLSDSMSATSVRAGAAADMAAAGATFPQIVAASRGHAPVMPGQTMMEI